MSHKSAQIATLIAGCQGQELDAHYLGFFACFNQGWFYEAHDVLEELWLECRGGPDAAFYQGLIQLAGAFVHLQKDRLGPAAALFALAARKLDGYPPMYHRLSLVQVQDLITRWRGELSATPGGDNPWRRLAPPTLALATAA